MRCHELLVAAAAEHPDRTAIHWVDRDRSLTYTEAVDDMNRAGATLSAIGLGDGGRVGIFAHPGLDYVVGLLGAWRLGAAAALVDLESKEQFGALMAAVAPAAVIYTNDHFSFVQPAMASLPSVGVYAGMDGPQEGTVGWLDALAAVDPTSVPLDRAGDAVALVVPNIAAALETITHQSLLTSALALADRSNIGAGDITMCPSPLADRFHLEASILPALARGASAGMLKNWDADSGYDAIEKCGSTIFCGHPSHCRDLLELSVRRGGPPKSLRLGITTSDAADNLTNRFQAELGLELLTS